MSTELSNDLQVQKCFNQSISKNFHKPVHNKSKSYILEYSRDHNCSTEREKGHSRKDSRPIQISGVVENFKRFIPEKHAKNIIPNVKKQAMRLDANNNPKFFKKNVKLYDEDFYHLPNFISDHD